MESASDPEVEENPEWVWELFRHYDQLYFRGALVCAPFTLEWTAPRLKTSSGFGSCSFGKMGKTITLYKPMLQHRTKADVKNALLHLMIHAIIFEKHGTSSLSWHGAVFRDWMDAINACSIEDYLRPKGGYCITTTHDFSPGEIQSIQGNLWKCDSCAVTLLRATKLGPPSDSCCIENVSGHATCGNMLCHWHNHKMNCGGTYVVPKRGQKMVPKGKRGLLTRTSETSDSQDSVQESDSDEFQDYYTVAKPNTEGNLLSQVAGRNAKSPGSSYSKKASKINMPEDFQKAIVPATPRRKLKLKQEFVEFVASEKHRLSSVGKYNSAKSPGSCSSKKAEDFQKAIVSSASSLSKLKRKQTSVASEKNDLRPVESFYDAKSSRGDTSRKAGRWHMPEHIQKSNVQPAPSQKKLKLEEDLTLSEKYGVVSLWSDNNAKLPGSSTSRKASKWHKPEGVEKSSVALSPPPKKLKLEQDLVDKHMDTKPLGGSTGNKEGKLHKPEGTQKASVLPAAPPRKLKQNLVASEKNERSSFAGKSNANVPDNISSKKAHMQRQHEETRKPIAQPAAPQSILKQQNKTNSSTKAEKQHNPEDVRRTFFQPAVSQSKLEQSDRVVPERPRTRSVAQDRQKTRSVALERQKIRSVAPEKKKTRSVASRKKKEYACVSVWANIYESECSSGSVEPLVNKRTERRKRERERSRPKKRSAGGIGSMKAQPAEEEVSSEQAKPPPQSQCLEFILIDTPDEVVAKRPRDQSKAPATRMDIVVAPPADKVMTQAPRGHSQPQAQCMDIVQPLADLAMTRARRDPPVPSRYMDIAAVPPAGHLMTRTPVHQLQTPAPCSTSKGQVVPPHSADPPSITPNSSSNPDVIDISDDD